MILLATNKRDVTTDFVVLELQRRGLPYVRLNTEDVAEVTLVSRPIASELEISVGSRTVDVAAVTGAYYRRPAHPDIEDEADDPAVAPYRRAEWSAALRSLWNALEGRWLNSPFAILRAEDKPRQLGLAARVGFAVPETLVTNDPAAAVAFTAGPTSIAKPLRHALLEEGSGAGRVIFTQRIEPLGAKDAEAVRQAPLILQREIPKEVDLRVIVVGDRVFATAIHSQGGEETRVDWRRGSNPDLPHEPVELDETTAAMCREITRRLGLRFGAIDLVRATDGGIWFVEINPNGQWAWIQNRTGALIAEAIVDELCG